MHLWRISNHASLTGIGASLAEGRWHSIGEEKRVVYFAEHAAVALIENLVNLSNTPRYFPAHFQLIKVAAPDSVSQGELSPEQIASIDPESTAATQAIGDAWLASQASALLRVPSIPSPESWNFLLNPLHPHAASLTVEWSRPITYDKRLFQLTHA
jgi:RES domain-containing protein